MSSLSDLYTEFITDIHRLPRDISIAVYGAGKVGQALVASLEAQRSDITIELYFDTYKHGTLGKYPIYLFADNAHAARDVDCIIIASIFWPDIENDLIRSGVENYIIAAEDPLTTEMLFSPATQQQDAATFADNLASLADARSKHVYSTCFSLRSTLFPRKQQSEKYAAPESVFSDEKQYLRFINWEKVHTAIDCGVFDGETTEDFLSLMPAGSRVIGFEANPHNVAEFDLEARFASLSGTLEQKALWHTNCQLELLAMGPSSQTKEASSESDAVLVDAVSLDDYVRHTGITVDVLKVDVEGGETDVLAGAWKTIIAHRPQLAICIYHSASDFISIPELLRTRLANYSHFAAHYGKEIFHETVWFSIPNECLMSRYPI